MEYIKAFVVGGLFCVIAQLLIDKTKLTPARILVGYVCAGVLLTGFGIYDKILDFAGCGASVPLTGFGYSLAKGVEEAVERFGLMGAFSGGLSSTASGVTLALLSALVVSLIFKSKSK